MYNSNNMTQYKQFKKRKLKQSWIEKDKMDRRSTIYTQIQKKNI